MAWDKMTSCPTSQTLLLDAELARAQQRFQAREFAFLGANLPHGVGVAERLLEIQLKQRLFDFEHALDQFFAKFSKT